jgi:hypothetical protein
MKKLTKWGNGKNIIKGEDWDMIERKSMLFFKCIMDNAIIRISKQNRGMKNAMPKHRNPINNT